MSPKLDTVIGVHSNIELDRNDASIAARKITLIGASEEAGAGVNLRIGSNSITQLVLMYLWKDTI